MNVAKLLLYGVLSTCLPPAMASSPASLVASPVANMGRYSGTCTAGGFSNELKLTPCKGVMAYTEMKNQRMIYQLNVGDVATAFSGSLVNGGTTVKIDTIGIGQDHFPARGECTTDSLIWGNPLIICSVLPQGMKRAMHVVFVASSVSALQENPKP